MQSPSRLQLPPLLRAELSWWDGTATPTNLQDIPVPSGHYGGGSVNHIPAGEDWKHVAGPIFVYFNALEHPKDPSPTDLGKLTASFGSGKPEVPAVWQEDSLALWQDAVAKSKVVKAA